MYEELIMRLLEDKSWIEQGTTETEHEIADHLQKAVNAIEELSVSAHNGEAAYSIMVSLTDYVEELKQRKTGKWIY